MGFVHIDMNLGKASCKLTFRIKITDMAGDASEW